MTHVGKRQRQAAAPARIGGGGSIADQCDSSTRRMIDPVVRTVKLRERARDLSTIQPFRRNAGVPEAGKEFGNAFVSTQPPQTITLTVHQVGPGALVSLRRDQDLPLESNNYIGRIIGDACRLKKSARNH